MDIIPAIKAQLVASPTLMSYLPSGANGVILAGNIALGRIPDTTPLPVIAIQYGGSFGTARTMPWQQDIILFRVYDAAPAANNLSYVQINTILAEIVNVLHRRDLTIQTSYYNPFELYFDNYTSPDLYDDFLKLPYKYVRFRMFGVSTIYDPR